MDFQLSYINQGIRSDPKGFLAEWDGVYEARVAQAAETIAQGLHQSPVVLLSGPSGSGKTTTAGKLQAALKKLGVTSHTVSMDDYFKTPGGKDYPRTSDGSLDFESPYCLDLDLLNQHFDLLEQGEEILVPSFCFSRHMRDTSLVRPLRAGRDEAIIFEGIHALNDLVTDRHPHAQRLYISARCGVAHQDDVLVKSTWTRLLRRCVRDYNYRGTDAADTLTLWANVRLGEKLYISPFKDKAQVQLDTSLAYEVSVLMAYAAPLLKALPEDAPRREEILTMLENFRFFEPVAPELVSADSLLQEFIR